MSLSIHVRTHALYLALGGLVACGAAVDSEPRLLSLSPTRGEASAPLRVTITGEGLRPSVWTDFSHDGRDTVDTTFQARLGPEALDEVQLIGPDQLEATVPAGLASGLYDLTVVDPSGREATLARAFEVLATSGERTRALAGFRFEAVNAQHAWEPFTVTVLAVDGEGQRLSGFNGSAKLTDDSGTAVPSMVGPFRDGVWSGQLEVRRTMSANVLRLDDSTGHTGVSAPFEVTARAAVALRFVTPARSVTAGECTSVVTLARIDDQGDRVATREALDISLEEDLPRTRTLYADASCATPLARLSMDAGADSVSFYLRIERAGGSSLTASTGTLRSAVQPLKVVPAAPARLAFASFPDALVLGTCSGPVALEVRDAFDNPTLTPGPTQVDLAAEPTQDYTFNGDPTCASSIAGLALTPASRVALFYVRGMSAGTVIMRASAPGLDSARGAISVRAPLRPEAISSNRPARDTTEVFTLDLDDRERP
ncbi:IPT/TIG domain-containing protein [Myxococcaceae bacterium JPH2]|nr:IPT/TIG domain-containing protein [Myxococcaceae bacterium JPH2]